MYAPRSISVPEASLVSSPHDGLVPGVELMRLWTVQGSTHWKRATAMGRLTGGPQGQHIDPLWKPAYEWMRRQMALRVPRYSGDFPVWCWIESPCGHLRHAGGWGSSDEEMMLVVMEVPTNRIVLSSFHAWHAVLNDMAVDLDESGDTPPDVDKEASWQRIFDPADPMTLCWGSPPTIQACVDGVDLQREVVAVLPFKVVT